LVRRVDVPETILKWSRLAREHENDHEVAESELADSMAKFCNLQAAIDCPDYDSDPSVFVSCALGIDAELAGWYARWQSSFLFATIIAREMTPEVFEDYWHLYPNIMVALILNHYRCIRTLVNQIIITQLTAMRTGLDPDLILEYSAVYNDQMDSSRRMIIELSHEICASVPYYMGSYPGYQVESWNSSNDYASENARAKLMLWPLYVAGQAEHISDIMRAWLIEQLETLSKEMGKHKSQAKGLAMLLRTRGRA
jgi:hypothetical protein